MAKINKLKSTRSICPECFKVVDATIYEKDGKVLITKECLEHGIFEDIYWSSYDEYVRAQKYAIVGEGIENPMTECLKGHPFDCGLCPNHKSHVALAIIDITNRCNLRCPICFANAAVTGYVYEPSQEQIQEMLYNLRQIQPVPATALQFSGGEPTIREDLPNLVKMAKSAGFEHIEINTNGIRLAESPELCHKLIEAGMSTIYLQFDGVTSEPYIITRGLDLLETKLKAIENCRKAGLDSMVLVPTVVKGVNENQMGEIINFALKNFDVIRCINFQPVSITGRIDQEKRKEMRITIPDCLKLIEDQTNNQIRASDFYPVSTVVPVARAVGALKRKEYVEFTAHEHCGMATFVFVEDGVPVPITRNINVDKFIESLKQVYETASKGSQTKAKLRMLASLRHVEFGLVQQLIDPLLKEGTYNALGNLTRRMIMIGMMHFQDLWNFDLERVERCPIHYAVPDGRVIPFCTMNTIYRQEIEEKYGVPIKEWSRKKTGT